MKPAHNAAIPGFVLLFRVQCSSVHAAQSILRLIWCMKVGTEV